MKILYILCFVLSLTHTAQAQGVMDSLRSMRDRALQGASDFIEFNHVPVRQKADEINQLIRAQIESEYAEMAANEDGIMPNTNQGNIVRTHYEMSDPNQRAMWAEDRINNRREATECQSQDLASTLLNSVDKDCGIADLARNCREFRDLVKLKEDELKEDPRVKLVLEQLASGGLQANRNVPGYGQLQQIAENLPDNNGVRIRSADFQRLQNQLTADIPSTDRPRAACYNALKKLGSSKCLSVYERVFDQSMQHNLTYLCLPETVDEEVQIFINAARNGGISSRAQLAQAQYVEGRNRLIDLTQILAALTQYLNVVAVNQTNQVTEDQ